jgi:hypothetical protein
MRSKSSQILTQVGFQIKNSLPMVVKNLAQFQKISLLKLGQITQVIQITAT